MKRNMEAGERYGKFVVVNPYAVAPRKALVRCDCGQERLVERVNLRRGNSLSCGRHERRWSENSRNTKHGQAAKGVRSRAYTSWSGMLQRCANPNSSEFHNYGARGIAVCAEWRDFATFYRDMGDPPPGMSIERINNNKGYSPENCKWATPREQSENRRCVKRISLNGRTQSLAAWAREMGIRRGVVYKRLKNGWDVTAAITTRINVSYQRGRL